MPPSRSTPAPTCRCGRMPRCRTTQAPTNASLTARFASQDRAPGANLDPRSHAGQVPDSCAARPFRQTARTAERTMRAPIRVRRMAASASRARRTARLAGLCFRMHPAEPPRSSAAWSSVPVIPDAGSRPGSLVRVGAPSAAEELSRGNFHIGLSLAPPVDSFMGRSACGHTNTKARRVTPSPEGPPMLPNTFARRIVLRGEADRFTLRARSLLSIVAGVAAGVSLACGGESLGSGAGDAGAKPSSSGGSRDRAAAKGDRDRAAVHRAGASRLRPRSMRQRCPPIPPVRARRPRMLQRAAMKRCSANTAPTKTCNATRSRAAKTKSGW